MSWHYVFCAVHKYLIWHSCISFPESNTKVYTDNNKINLVNYTDNNKINLVNLLLGSFWIWWCWGTCMFTNHLYLTHLFTFSQWLGTRFFHSLLLLLLLLLCKPCYIFSISMSDFCIVCISKINICLHLLVQERWHVWKYIFLGIHGFPRFTKNNKFLHLW